MSRSASAANAAPIRCAIVPPVAVGQSGRERAAGVPRAEGLGTWSPVAFAQPHTHRLSCYSTLFSSGPFGASRKGRTGSSALACLLRRLAALVLASGLIITYLDVPTEYSAADRPSRGPLREGGTQWRSPGSQDYCEARWEVERLIVFSHASEASICMGGSACELLAKVLPWAPRRGGPPGCSPVVP